MDISVKGVQFITREEGEVLKAYRDSAGVWTIGVGLTSASGVIKPKRGMVISHDESQRLLHQALETKYVPAVQKILPVSAQHEFDAACSVVWNCGTGALAWKWAKALAGGRIKESAEWLRKTAVTAGGKRLQGLVNRRAREARLIELGDYGFGHQPTIAKPRAKPEVVSSETEVKLQKLGYDTRDLAEAIKKFQAKNGLTVDGIAGPATRSTIQREIDGKKAASTSVAAGTGSGAGAGGLDAAQQTHIDIAQVATNAALVALAVTILVAGLYLVYRYRGPLFAWLPDKVKDFFQFKLGVTIGRRVQDV